MVGELDGWKISDNLFLLENLRFYKGEEENDQGFAKRLSSLADNHINDAFAVSHIAHASTVGVPKYLPHLLFRIQHEKLTGVKSALLVADLNEERTDIASKSTENFLQIINLAKTVVWNGPVGMVKNRFNCQVFVCVNRRWRNVRILKWK